MRYIIRLTGFILGIGCITTKLFAQAPIPEKWSDVILEEKGDTVVVKPSSMAPGYLNTLFYAIRGDTLENGARANPNRVYETVRGQAYIYDRPAQMDVTIRNLRIVAPPGTDMPPVHYKSLDPEGTFLKGFFRLRGGNFYMENQYLIQGVINDTQDRQWFRAIADSCRTEFKNCVVELSNWTWLSNFAAHVSIKVTDCLIMNIGREANLEKGNIIDGDEPADTVWFENNTILNSGNFMISRPNVGPSFVYFNHNTIVNATGNPFLFFSQAEHVVTNNIFVNTGLVPDYPGFYPFNEDEDKLPKGIINVDTLESSWIDSYWYGTYPVATDADRKILVDKNSAWWDSRFTDMFNNSLAPIPDSVGAEWASQMIKMNSRTQAMFDDDAAYPYFNEGTWYDKAPDFANNQDLVPDWIDFIVTNAIPGDPNGGSAQPIWRTNTTTNLVQADWPPLPDLSYTDAELYTGGVNNYPLGDLNWFPSMKESWNKTGEAEVLIEALKSGNLPEDWTPLGIEKKESIQHISPQVTVYPNPVIEMTTVRYEITSETDVEVILYNLTGKKIRVEQLGYQVPGTHEFSLDIGNLNPGMYILQIHTNSNNSGLTTKLSIK